MTDFSSSWVDTQEPWDPLNEDGEEEDFDATVSLTLA
jgi:hypothetical protein